MHKKLTNVKSIALNKTAVTLRKGKTFTIKATITKVKSMLALVGHVSKLRYKSSNTAVATVSSKGIITAKGSGSCKVYVYGQNGYAKAVTVTVK